MTSMIDPVQTSSEIHAIIDLHATVNLSCGWKQLLHVVTLMTRPQVKKFMCQIHNRKHDISDYEDMMDYIVGNSLKVTHKILSRFFFTS